MEPISNEILFYSGIGIACGAAVLGLLVFCILQIHKVKLKFQLDQEYGEK